MPETHKDDSTRENAVYIEDSLTIGADGYIDIDEHSSAPGNPAAGNVRFYVKSDEHLHKKNSAGTEKGLMTGPASAVDNELFSADGTSGKDAQGSGGYCTAGAATFGSVVISGHSAVDFGDFDSNHTILKADAANTPGALIVNEQRLLGRITGGNIDDLTATQALGVIADRLACHREAARTYDGMPFGSPPTGTDVAAVADQIYARRFFSWGETYDAIGITVRTLEAAKGCKLAIYNEGSDGYPSSLVHQTGALALAAVADIEEAGIAHTLAVGWYWIALLSDSAGVARFEAITMNYHRMHGWTDYGSNHGTNLRIAGEAYAGGFDDPFPAGATINTAATAHRILLKTSA